MKCLSCGRQINLDDKLYDFTGSVKCFYCSTVMEIQTARGVLIWVNPFSVVNPDYAGRNAERDLQVERDILSTLQRNTPSQNNM